ncbi:Zinc finger, CCHC domain-containing protein [Podochytrium sp. JEL0797]|nr:Zinc finger, CCHC domain-containing protein [Podochytrium sp. JEL0797]
MPNVKFGSLLHDMDSGMSTTSSTDFVDEAATLFHFDEENHLDDTDHRVLDSSSGIGRVQNGTGSDGSEVVYSKRSSSSMDGSMESSSDAYTWIGSYSDQIHSATRSSIDSKWKSPTSVLGIHTISGHPPLLSPHSNFAEPHPTEPSFRPHISPSFSSVTGVVPPPPPSTGGGAGGRRSVNASPGVVSFQRTSVDALHSGRFGSIGTNGRADSGFKLPPAIDGYYTPLVPGDLPRDKSPLSAISPHQAYSKDAKASPLFLPSSSDTNKNIWGAPDMNIGVSVFRTDPTTTSTTTTPTQHPSIKPSSNYTPSTSSSRPLAPSELLRRNVSFERSSAYFGPASTQPRFKSVTTTYQPDDRVSPSYHHASFPTPSATYPTTITTTTTTAPIKTKLNPLVSAFELQIQDPAAVSPYDTYSSHDASPSFGFRQPLDYTPQQHMGGGGVGFAYPPSTTINGLPPRSSTYDYYTTPNRTTTSTPTSPSTTTTTAATDLRIVKEIQTSKLRVDESKLTASYFSQLTRESRALCFHVCPGVEERVRQSVAVGNVWEVVRGAFGGDEGVGVFQFGSTAMGFALANAEVDLAVSCGVREGGGTAAGLVERLGGVMKSAGMRDVKMLARARVPIVKIRDPSTGIRCDIGFQNNLVVYNTRLLMAYSELDPRFRELVLIVKFWSKQRNINEPYFGTLSSYCFVLMIIHFLQTRGVLPCLQQIAPDGTLATTPETKAALPVVEVDGFNVYFYEDVHALVESGGWDPRANDESVGELVVAFFKYFSAEFPYVHGVASVRTGGVLPKEEKGWTKDKQQEINRSGAAKDRYWLCVEDPFETTNNVGRPVDKETLFEVRGEFIRASKILCSGSTSTTTSEDTNQNILSRVCEKAPVVISKRGAGGGGGGSGPGGMAMSRKW